MVNEPRVSVIVPAYNAADTIVECVQSLLALDYPKKKLELAFVDDGSEDDTVKLIEGFKGVVLVRQEHGGPAAARNLGLKNTGSEVVAFTDADCIVPKDWVTRIVAELGEADAVGGSLTPVSTDTLAERFEQHRRDRLYGSERRFVPALPTCNLAFKREAIEEAGGFDEDFKKASAEDYDLCTRVTAASRRILYEPSISVLHKHSQTMEGIMKRALTHGTEIIRYRLKHGRGRAGETVKACVKLAATPILVVTRYPPTMIPLGLAYELLSLAGNIRGLLTV
jgi:glycosyltransferase involved in cell wall biosynthesis